LQRQPPRTGANAEAALVDTLRGLVRTRYLKRRRERSGDISVPSSPPTYALADAEHQRQQQQQQRQQQQQQQTLRPPSPPPTPALALLQRHPSPPPLPRCPRTWQATLPPQPPPLLPPPPLPPQPQQLVVLGATAACWGT
jgi:hypothetical protein